MTNFFYFNLGDEINWMYKPLTLVVQLKVKGLKLDYD